MRQALVARAAARAPCVRARRVRDLAVSCAAASLAAVVSIGGARAQTLAALPPPSASPPAASLPPIGPRLAGTGKASATPASVDFCRRMPAECRIDPAEPTTVALTPEVWQTMAAVNREVNERIKPVTDLERWGVIDRWDFPDDGVGDCEDYQLLKRRILVERGLPRRAMLMTVVLDDQGNGHAVMMVRTDRGDFILDNQRSAVLAWKETGYAFVKRESQTGRAWVSLEANAATVATAMSEED